jgi:hypothetical protein
MGEARITGYQGDRWGIVPGCTCLWDVSETGWLIVAEDANCPAHHADRPSVPGTA